MNKSLPLPTRQFGLNLKNTINDQQLQDNLALKPKSRKRCDSNSFQLTTSRPEMAYYDEVMKYALTKVSYPHILRGPQKVKRDIESLLHEIVSTNGHNCVWHENFLNQGTASYSYFRNKEITLEKRTTLVDWIITVHKRYTLKEETLFLTIRLFDQYCQKNHLPLSKYQLIGITALFTSAKFTEIELPRFKDYHRLIQAQFTSDDMLEMESELLRKSQFSLCRKISALWYLEAFAIQEIIFPLHPKYSKTQKEQARDNRFTAAKQTQEPEQKYQKFMEFAKYILNMVQLDYKITLKYKEDIIAIAALVFATIQKEFMDTDAKGLMKFFVDTKYRLIEQNEKSDEICKAVKKCMKKIENLYAKRSEKRFDAINQKFDRIAKKL